MQVLFPKNEGLPEIVEKRHYDLYYKYILSVFEYSSFKVKFVKNPTESEWVFTVKIEDKKVAFDYSKYPAILQDILDKVDIYFKLRYMYLFHDDIDKVLPFTPVSFRDWQKYYRFRKVIKYQANGEAIVNRQKTFGGARFRRTGVQTILSKLYTKSFKTGLVDQTVFWKEVGRCLVGIFVPGSYNDMLDRGHLQYLGFGCCTVSPKITNILPYNKELTGYCIGNGEVKNSCYVQCADDFSNLVDILKWCENNRDTLVEIGQNAKELFDKTATPGALIRWIASNVEEI